ncbi:MAG: hypothetical protein WCJ09_07590 [Planctomycetota bacterium]
MRFIGLATLFCVTVTISTVFGAPPVQQSIIDQQHQLIEAQQEDDRQRAKIEEINKQLGGGSNDSLESQIAADRIRQFVQVRETRAAQYWELLGTSGSLQQPLTDSQRIELDSFSRIFVMTAKGQLAAELLNEHNRLMRAAEAERQSMSRTASRAAEAKARLESLQLKTVDEELSESQLTQLIELNKAYAETEAAAVARRYLRAHSNRRFREDAEQTGLLTPEILEQLASQRLSEARRRFGNEKSNSQLRQELANIVDDYPGTQACRQATTQIIEVQEAIDAEAQRLRVEAEQLRARRAAEAERSRFINEYWDAVYPDRVRKGVTPQR